MIYFISWFLKQTVSTCLNHYSNQILKVLTESGKSTNMISIDSQKAFSTQDHNILEIFKMKYLGFTSKTTDYFSS